MIRFVLPLVVIAFSVLAITRASPQEAPRAPESRRAAVTTFRPTTTRPAWQPAEVGHLMDDLHVAEIRTFTDPAPPPLFDVELWAQEADRILSERFEVPSVKLYTYPKLRAREPYTCESINLYDRVADRINLPLADIHGKPIPASVLRYAYFHAYLHHLEKWRAVPRAAPGHEPEFDRWMQVIGFIPAHK